MKNFRVNHRAHTGTIFQLPKSIFSMCPVLLVVLICGAVLVVSGLAQELTAEEVLERVRAAWRAQSFHGLVELEVQQQGETRGWRLEVWSQGEERALIRVLAPEEEAGSGYLVLGDEVWYYSPEIGEAIQLPAFALAEGAFGEAVALEDVFRGTLAGEYEASLEPWQDGYLLILIPKPAAPVVYGGLKLLVREDYALLEIRYFDQRGNLLRVARFSEFIDVDGRPVPTVAEVEEVDGDKTVEQLIEPEFGIEIPEEVFTLESLEGG